MADFTLSPGIVTNEYDKSIRQAVVSTGSVAGLIGEFNWGPAMIPTMVHDENELIEQFGKPTNLNFNEWFNGKNFLDYGTDLNVVRVVDESTAKNANFSGAPLFSPNEQFYVEKLIVTEGGLKEPNGYNTPDNPRFGNTTDYGGWLALFPGDLGNSLRVEMCFATERASGMKMNINNYIMINDKPLNEVSFTKILDGRENFYEIRFSNWTGTMRNTVDFEAYFGDRSDILASTADANQEKVISFTLAGTTFNVLAESFVGGGADPYIKGYVNINDGSSTIDTTPLSLTSPSVYYDGLNPIVDDSILIRERSFFNEYSYGAKIGSPNNLLGKVHYTHNTQKLFGKGTAFSKQVNVGDKLDIAGQTIEVQQIVSDTEIVLMKNIIGTVDSNNPVPWTRRWKYASTFGKEPATSNDIRQVNGDITGDYNDQLHMVVIDVDGKITGEIGRVIEAYGFMSLAKDGKDDYKNPTYYVNKVNNASTWIRWTNHLLPDINTNWGEKSLGTVFKTYNKNSGMSGVSKCARTFTAGSDGNAVANEDMFRAIEIFKSKELWELDFFLTGWTNSDIDYHITISKMIQAAEERKDCVVCVSGQFNRIILDKPDTDAMTSEMIAWRGGILDSSYAIMDGNFKYQYDPYNDTYRWITLSGDVAGLMARTDAEYKPWFSPAGHNRGQIKNVVKLAFSPTQSQRDAMYLDQINPVITVRGEGTLLYGDKTMQRIASAFDRINVRRLFISMKDFVVGQARLKLFEFNTPATRAQFRREIENYLTLVQTQQGLSDYRVICDETNNTNDLIEQNRFVADIYVKPNYVINFIKLNFTAVGQTVEFSDLGV